MPALYLAREFRARGDQVLFVGSGRPLEAKLIDADGFERAVIDFVGLRDRSLSSILRVLCSFPRALVQTISILRKYKPNLVLGMGGYVTVPPVFLARVFGVPSWIHEAELLPGRATRVLKYVASKISLAFPSNPLSQRNNAVITGHPVRPEIASVTSPDLNNLALKHVLVVGGSQGAAALDLYVPQVLANLNISNLSVWHQCREQNVEEVRKRYAQCHIDARVESFIDQMTQAYQFADLIISRSGAGAVMEIGAINRVAVFVPFPHAQGGHQALNAKILADSGRAIIVEEGEAFDHRLESALRKLAQPGEMRRMLELPPRIRPLEAVNQIVDGCHALVGGLVG